MMDDALPGQIVVRVREHEVFLGQEAADGRKLGSFVTPETAEAVANALIVAATQARIWAGPPRGDS